MKRSLHYGVLFVLSVMFVISGLALTSFAASTTTKTSVSTTTTTGTGGRSLVFKGHSPVDLEVCYNSETVANACLSPGITRIGPINQKDIIGCTASCTRFSNIIYVALFSISPLSIATFTGPSGTGCDTESTLFTETITISNAPAGTYTLELYPSTTFFANTGAGCHHHTTTTTTQTSFGYTITVSDSNNEVMTGTINGPNSPPPPPNTGSLSSGGTITFSSTFPTPVFPIGTILAIVIPLLALVTYMVVSTHMPRKKDILPAPL
jgi:hypothetical protein